MRGFLLAMMVLGLVSAAVGCLMFLASLLDVRLAVVFVPPLIATEVMIGFGFLLAATAGGMAEMIRLLNAGNTVPAPSTSRSDTDYYVNRS